MSKHADDTPKMSELEELWDTIRAAVKRIDEISDQEAIEEGELYPEDIPDGQVINNIAIAYSLSHVAEDGQPEFMMTYTTAPNATPEAVIGLFRVGQLQAEHDSMQDV